MCCPRERLTQDWEGPVPSSPDSSRAEPEAVRLPLLFVPHGPGSTGHASFVQCGQSKCVDRALCNIWWQNELVSWGDGVRKGGEWWDLGALLLQKANCSPTLRGFKEDFLVKSDVSKFNVKPSSWSKHRFIHLI